MDIALGEELSGEVQIHISTCPHVRTLASLGQPVFTLFEIEWADDLVPDVKRHSCMDPYLHQSNTF